MYLRLRGRVLFISPTHSLPHRLNSGNNNFEVLLTATISISASHPLPHFVMECLIMIRRKVDVLHRHTNRQRLEIVKWICIESLHHVFVCVFMLQLKNAALDTLHCGWLLVTPTISVSYSVQNRRSFLLLQLDPSSVRVIRDKSSPRRKIAVREPPKIRSKI